MTQPALFPDETKPCTACRGTGLRDDPETLRVTVCRACQGSGRHADRPQPEYDPLPEGF
jgi:DnaJ-class molecular chaperone